MSENLERKSADFARSLIKFLCIFRPGPRQNFFIAAAGAGPRQNRNPRPGPRSITAPGRWSPNVCLAQNRYFCKSRDFTDEV